MELGACKLTERSNLTPKCPESEFLPSPANWKELDPKPAHGLKSAADVILAQCLMMDLGVDLQKNVFINVIDAIL